MRFTVSELNSPPIKSFIEEHYVPWYSNVDTSTDWYTYASGLGGFTLPLICVIDPANPDNYLDRTTGLQYAEEFYSRLQYHTFSPVLPPGGFPWNMFLPIIINNAQP